MTTSCSCSSVQEGQKRHVIVKMNPHIKRVGSSSSINNNNKQAFVRIASSMVVILLLLTSPTAVFSEASSASTTASAADFTVDVTMAVCPGLKPISVKVAANPKECAQVCYNNPSCDVWQYCPEGVLCRLDYKIQQQRKYIQPNVARCYISDATTKFMKCVPDATTSMWYNNTLVGPTDHTWIGKSNNPNRMPMKTSQPVSIKRGFSGNLLPYIRCDDSMKLGLQTSWYYDWMRMASMDNACRYKDRLWPVGPNPYHPRKIQMGSEFVPMIIGKGNASQILANLSYYKREWEQSNVHFILGYNEPDPAWNHPHSMEAADAAKDWVQVQKVAASFDPPLTLVSPGISSTDFDENGRSQWLDYFFGNCSEIVDECNPKLIKYIAYHDYQRNVDSFQQRIDGIYRRYGKRKLWLTEYSINWGPEKITPLREEQNAYLKATLPILESDPRIYRYVWFNSRSPTKPWFGEKDLLIYDKKIPTLTSTGKIYKQWPKSTNSNQKNKKGNKKKNQQKIGTNALKKKKGTTTNRMKKKKKMKKGKKNGRSHTVEGHKS